MVIHFIDFGSLLLMLSRVLDKILDCGHLYATKSFLSKLHHPSREWFEFIIQS